MITFNEIYTVIRGDVITSYSGAYVTSNYEPLPGAFPAVSVREVSKSIPNENVSLNFTENVHEVTIEVQIFSNKVDSQKEEADGILSVIEGSMRKMFFVETSAAPVDNADASIYRINARFRRVVCDADSITGVV